MFAPRNPAEFHRVLRPHGRLVVVRPTPRHLAELRDRLPGMVAVDPDKERRLHRALDPYFEDGGTERVEYRLSLDAADALDLVAMTPSARHLEPTGWPGGSPSPPSSPSTAPSGQPRRTSYRKQPYSTARTWTDATSGSLNARARAAGKSSLTSSPPRMCPCAE